MLDATQRALLRGPDESKSQQLERRADGLIDLVIADAAKRQTGGRD